MLITTTTCWMADRQILSLSFTMWGEISLSKQIRRGFFIFLIIIFLLSKSQYIAGNMEPRSPIAHPFIVDNGKIYNPLRGEMWSCASSKSYIVKSPFVILHNPGIM